MTKFNNGRVFTMFTKTIFTTAALALASTAATAQSETLDADGMASSEQVDLAELLCWDVVTLAEDDRASTMVLLYGYALGTQGKSVVAPQDIQITIINAMMDCVDTPDDKVLAKVQEKMADIAIEE